jgi:transposase
MEFGSIWKKKLQSLLGQNLSYREIARKLHVDTNTVIKYKKVLNSECIQIKKTSNQSKGEVIKSQRQEWLLLMQGNQNLS